MIDNIKPGEAYTFANYFILPVKGATTSGAATYLTFIDNILGVTMRGGMKRKSAQPTLEELRASQ